MDDMEASDGLAGRSHIELKGVGECATQGKGTQGHFTNEGWFTFVGAVQPEPRSASLVASLLVRLRCGDTSATRGMGRGPPPKPPSLKRVARTGVDPRVPWCPHRSQLGRRGCSPAMAMGKR